jgi:hypothetical protein
MKNYFVKMEGKLFLMYRDRFFHFDMNDVDPDDFWDSFTYNGEELDIYYYPVLDSLTIYNVHDETGQIDTSQFETAEYLGNLTNKYVVIDVAQRSNSDEYIRRYKDSGDIIMYDSYTLARTNVIPTEAVVLVAGLYELNLETLLTQMKNNYERDNAFRGA